MTPSDNYLTISPHNLALLHSTLLHSYPVPLIYQSEYAKNQMLNFLKAYDQVVCQSAKDRGMRGLRGFHMRAKCKISMIIELRIILMMVFWPVCTQISITKGNLNSAIQIMV